MFTRHRITQLMAALIVLLGLLVGPAGVAPASAATLSCFYIQASNSLHYLDVEGASTANGARIVQWYQTGAQNQKFKVWHYDSQPDASYIESVWSGKVLSVNSYVAGAPVLQWDNTGATAQQWQSIPVTGGAKYRNLATGLYLDISGDSRAAGARLVQWYGSGGGNQVFKQITTSCA
jgi:hypothetical protein